MGDRTDADVSRGSLGEPCPVVGLERLEKCNERVGRLDEAVTHLRRGQLPRLRDGQRRGGDRIERGEVPGRFPPKPGGDRLCPEEVGAVEMHDDVATRPSVAAARVGPLCVGESGDGGGETPTLPHGRPEDRGRVAFEHEHRVGPVVRVQLHLIGPVSPRAAGYPSCARSLASVPTPQPCILAIMWSSTWVCSA